MESGARRMMTSKKKIVLATKNPGKIREMQNAFDELPIELIPLSDFGELPDAVEDGADFADNALIKARFYAGLTKCACLADDSGLEVLALGNAPGVRSARFAGGAHASDDANNEKLIAELNRVGKAESPAAYRCVLAYVDGAKEILTEGVCPGTVRTTPKGAGGFGYDPYFYVGGKTLAELTLSEKDKISHRGKALRSMAERLKEQTWG